MYKCHQVDIKLVIIAEVAQVLLPVLSADSCSNSILSPVANQSWRAGRERFSLKPWLEAAAKGLLKIKSGPSMKHFRWTRLKTKYISERGELYSLVSFGMQMKTLRGFCYKCPKWLGVTYAWSITEQTFSQALDMFGSQSWRPIWYLTLKNCLHIQVQL